MRGNFWKRCYETQPRVLGSELPVINSGLLPTVRDHFENSEILYVTILSRRSHILIYFGGDFARLT